MEDADRRECADSVALPEPVTLVGATEHKVLLVVRLTHGVAVDRCYSDCRSPCGIGADLTVVGLAAMVKSWTTKVTVTNAIENRWSL